MPKPEGCEIWPYFTHATLKLNGETVQHWDYLPGEPAPLSVSLAVMFDSTHWNASVQNVIVEFDAVDNLSAQYPLQRVYHAEYTVPIWNEASIFGRYDLEFPGHELSYDYRGDGQFITGNSGWHGCTEVSTKLDAMHYRNTSPVIYKGWDAAAFYGRLHTATVVYVNTHGDAGYFLTDEIDYNDLVGHSKLYVSNEMDGCDEIWGYWWTNQWGYWDVPAMSIFDTFHRRYVSTNCGPNLPPFNQGSPPVNFAFIDGCSTGHYRDGYGDGGSHQAAGLLWPYTNAYVSDTFIDPMQFDWIDLTGGDPIEDQAVASFVIETWADDTADIARTYYGFLLDGHTAWHARELTYRLFSDSLQDLGAADEFGWMHVNGDFYTRLHGVYKNQLPDLIHAETAWHTGNGQ